MKTSKRLLSLFLAIIMAVCLIPVTFSANAAGSVYYLSASGSDTNDGLSYEKPFATLKKAMEALGTNEGTIKIIGAYSPSSRNDNTTHTQNITIEGYDSSSSIDSSLSLLTFGGPVTLKNITYIRGTNSYMLSWGYDITFGEGFKTTHKSDWFVFGKGQGQTSVNDINVTVKDGTFTGKFNVGAIMPSSAGFTVANDANVNVSGGNISNIILGSTNWGACGAVNFAKSVVIQHDGGTITSLSATATGNGSPTKITGALIVINNNGSTTPAYDASLDSISVGAKYYINAPVGAYITPVVDENGNAVKGQFNVTISDSTKAAVFTNESGKVTARESGSVTLPEGATTVKLVNIEDLADAFFVSATGSDSNNGKSADTPFATLKKAMEALNGEEGTIQIIGAYLPPSGDYTAHSQNIIIEGYDTSASLDSTNAYLTFGGPVTLQNIKYVRGLNSYILSNGFDITFGEGFNTTSKDDWMVFGKGYGNTSADDINVTVKAGTFTGKFNVGAIMPGSAGYNVKNDANVNVSGGTISNIVLGSTNWGACGATTFSKSVVVQHDGGTITKISATATGNGSPTAITGSLIVINNNETAAPTYDATLDSISIGSKYYINSGKGGYVKPVVDENGNAVAGKFHITIDDDANNSAVIVNGDSKTTLSESGEITLQTGTTEITYANYPPNPGTTVPMEWKEMDKGYITFCFDDNRDDLVNYVDIVMGEFNMPLCAAVPSSTLTRNNALLHKIQDRGGEIISHTKTHLVIKPFVTPWADVETQLGDSYRELTADGFNINGIILAGGTGQISVDDTEYRGLIELVTNKYYKYSDKYGLSTQYWKQRNWFSGRTLDDLKKIVDTHIENKTWEVIYGHGLSECSEETIRGLCEYLAEKEAQGLVKVVTYKYMHEHFGDWESPVDFGKTTYSVDFYGTDGKTLVATAVVNEGEGATVPDGITVADGYTLKGWSGDFSNVTNNIKVTAICTDASGKTVSSTAENVVFPPAPPAIIYVDSANGLDTNDGETPETAVTSITKAVTLVENDKDFEIKIIGEYSLPVTIGGHTGMMTVSGYDESSSISTVASWGYTLAGPMTVKNIKFTNGLYAWFSANGNKLVLGEGITTSGNHQIDMGGNYGKYGTGYIDAEINSGTWSKLCLGPIAANKINEYTKDVNAKIYGGTVTNLVIGGDGWSTSHLGANYKKNINVNVSGGTVKNVKFGADNYAPTFEGALQMIFNGGATTAIASNVTSTNVAGGKYFVYSAQGGKVDFVLNADGNSKTGVFKITPDDGNYAIITNGENTSYLYAAGEVTLSAGTTNITYGSIKELDTVVKITDGDKEYVYFPEDVVNITHEGKISLPENMERNGHLFGGWYYDESFTKPVTNGETVRVGKIYARYIALSEKDLYVEGAQVRISGKLGLRYINNISHATRSALVSLNEKNAYLDPANDVFNTENGIGYGAIVFPEILLGENELVKNGVYKYGETSYGAATVPAKNTFETLDSYDRYTLVIVGIAKKNYVRNYITRPYITYVDASGMERTVYGKTYSTSMYEMAKHIYENDAKDEPEEKREEILDYLYTNILTKVDGVNNPLANTYRAVNIDKKLTVGYLGGSITNGSSATKTVNADGTVTNGGGSIASSFVNRTTAWLKEQFADVTVEAINAGISDTATNFGVYRLEDHLMNENGHDMPDLVFVEFTSNDWTYDDSITQSKADLSRQIESLVRNIYAKNPYADIVFVFTARSENAASRKQYVEIAEKYGIEYIDMGIPMQALMTARGHSQEASGSYYYTTDNLHPSAEGYRIYFEEIKKVLTKHLIDTPVYYTAKKDHESVMPKQLNRSLWLEPDIIPASRFEISGADISLTGAVSSSMYDMGYTSVSKQITPDSVTVTGTDAKASFTFTGTSFGLIFGMNSSGLDINYTIDGKDVKNISIDDDFLSFQRYGHTQLFVLEQELAYGEHKIEMTFNKTSDGNVNVKIGGAAVAGVDNGLQKLVALTIDDGPKNDASNAILDVLKKYGAHATFFVVGTSCNENTKDVLNRMLAEGSEIGNHSNGWTSIAELTTEEVLKDFNTAQEKIYSLTGFYPKVFRAPGNRMSEAAFAAIPVPVLNGYGIGTDWEEDYSHENRLANLRNAVGDGRVVLIHDKLQNVNALDIVLKELTDDGFKVVTASELIKLRGYNPEKYVQKMFRDFP